MFRLFIFIFLFCTGLYFILRNQYASQNNYKDPYPEATQGTEVKESPENVISGNQSEVFSSAGCSACHAMNNKLVGPALRPVLSRKSAEWLLAFLTNPDSLFEVGDSTLIRIKEDNSSSIHIRNNTFRNIKPEECRDIINETKYYNSELK